MYGFGNLFPSPTTTQSPPSPFAVQTPTNIFGNSTQQPQQNNIFQQTNQSTTPTFGQNPQQQQTFGFNQAQSTILQQQQLQLQQFQNQVQHQFQNIQQQINTLNTTVSQILQNLSQSGSACITYNGMQQPHQLGHASTLALIDGYRSVWTPNGLQVSAPSDPYRTPPAYLNYGATATDREIDAFKRGYEIGSSLSSHDLSRAPARKLASTSLADSYCPRPYTSPILSSSSSTSNFFGKERDADPRKRTLPWRRGYRDDHLSTTLDPRYYNWRNIMGDTFIGRNHDYDWNREDYPTTSRNKWKKLDENVARNCMYHSSAYKPRDPVKFLDPYDIKYSPVLRKGPPIKSNMEDVDLALYDHLWNQSNNNREKIKVGNLPGRFTEQQNKRNSLFRQKPFDRKDYPILTSLPIYKTRYESDRSDYLQQLARKPSTGSLVELFRASNRRNRGAGGFR